MNKKSLVALAAATAITVGLGAGSYAWFTSTATSTGNVFQTGTLGISQTADASWGATKDQDGKWIVKDNLANMQCGDERTYTFTVSNIKDNVVSTLAVKYRNVISNLAIDTPENLLDVARFDVTCTGENPINTNNNDLTFTQLSTLLGQDRILQVKGNTEVKDDYTITVKLPDDFVDQNGNDVNDDLYQGAQGAFQIRTDATQVGGTY
jgi:predicted ribosomally synthesized peptide with SipW-like signal peptide